jgi:sigma-B regulation protein RsbU (phosphoserine phosphatase)
VSRKVLVVDDAPDVRAWLRAVLEKAGWQVFEAGDGDAARRILETFDMRVVITDWMMPELDGMGLIEWIRGRQSREYVYTIMMTGRDREADCIAGLSGGADDFISKPASPAVLKARLKVAQRILSIHQELLAQQDQLRRSREMTRRAYRLVREDIEGASAAQRALLPSAGLLTDAVEASWFFRPAMGVSGDYLDIYNTGDDRLAFCLLDVSGHGVAAALRSAAISQMLRPISGLMDGLDVRGPADVVTRLNRHICETNQDVDYLATLVFGDLDAASGRLRLAAAGHPPPILLSPSMGARPIHGGGIPLGIDPQATYINQERILSGGETVLLYSDGLTECADGQGQHWGLDALQRTLAQANGQPPAKLLDSLQTAIGAWKGGDEFDDDLSALAIRFKGASGNPGHRPVEMGQ